MKILAGKNLKDIWEKNRTEFLALYSHEQDKPIGFEKLEKRFVDSEGRQYYGFPDNLPLPLERYGMSNEMLMWMSAGLTNKELEKLVSLGDEAIVSGLKVGKNAAILGWVFHEIKLRANMVIHTELLYNYLAYLVVREDEKVDVIDKEIQQQKVDQFKKETGNGNSYFFFRSPELKNLTWLWKLTESEWEKYWQGSVMEQNILKEKLSLISSNLESKEKGKTSKKGL